MWWFTKLVSSPDIFPSDCSGEPLSWGFRKWFIIEIASAHTEVRGPILALGPSVGAGYWAQVPSFSKQVSACWAVWIFRIVFFDLFLYNIFSGSSLQILHLFTKFSHILNCLPSSTHLVICRIPEVVGYFVNYPSVLVRVSIAATKHQDQKNKL